MNTITKLPFLAILSTVAVLGSEALAQESKQATPANIAADPVVSLDFTGGSLADFAAALRKAGNDINIVMPEIAAKVELPALTLSKATVESALRSIGAITSEDTRVRVETLRSVKGTPVYAVSVQIRNRRSTGGGPVTTQMPAPNQEASPLRVSVFSLKFLTDTVPGDSEADGLTMKPETILTAIDTGLGVRVGGSKPEFKYHEDSGLLFTQGNARQIGLVQNIIQSMESDIRRLRDATKMEEMNKRNEAARQKSGGASTGR